MYDPRMQLTSQVLRQVEFGSELRGYRTSEVDDFLEKAAVAVDGLASDVERLKQEAAVLREQLERAERAAREQASDEDAESIRRTLMLAQRTADLAIKEAKEEAAQLLDTARDDASAIVAEARSTAKRVVSGADRKLQNEVSRLRSERERLQGELDALAGLLVAERSRLIESLNTTLGYVEKNLEVTPELAAFRQTGESGSEAGEDGAEKAASPREGTKAKRESSDDDDDLEAGIAADAAAAGPSSSSRPADLDEEWESPGRLRRSRLAALPPLEKAGEESAGDDDEATSEGEAEEHTAVWRRDKDTGSPAS